MKIGKISEPMLKRSVLKRISYKNPEMFVGAGLSRDFASMKIDNDSQIILSTDTVTCGFSDIAYYGITKTANNIAVSGGKIKGVLVSITMPKNAMESELNELMRLISLECKKRQIEIIGGHTEASPYVNNFIVTFTGVGVRASNVDISVANIKPDMDIVMSKDIALEGTVMLANEREEELLLRFTRTFVDKAKELKVCLEIESEAAVAVNCGVQAMHDASKGGIFGALWEMAATADLGLNVYLDKINIRQETIEITELLDVNPYTLVSGGALLMVTSDGSALKEALLREGIKAEVIGKMTSTKDRVIIKGEDRRFLEPPKGDGIVILAE